MQFTTTEDLAAEGLELASYHAAFRTQKEAVHLAKALRQQGHRTRYIRFVDEDAHLIGVIDERNLVALGDAVQDASDTHELLAKDL